MYRHVVGALGATAMLALAANPAHSHITLETTEVRASAPFKAVLRVPHGCAGAATTAIAVTVPEGLIGAKPMPKAGWTLDIAKGDYARAYPFFHGSTLAKGAKAITWTNGSLPDDAYDEFVFVAYVWDAFRPGDTVAVPVVQTCADGRNQAWTETVRPGQPMPKTPAPVLTIIGGDAPASHHH